MGYSTSGAAPRRHPSTLKLGDEKHTSLDGAPQSYLPERKLRISIAESTFGPCRQDLEVEVPSTNVKTRLTSEGCLAVGLDLTTAGAKQNASTSGWHRWCLRDVGGKSGIWPPNFGSLKTRTILSSDFLAADSTARLDCLSVGKTLNPQPFLSKPAPLNPQPSTLNPQPSTLNPQPSTLNPQPSTLNPKP